MEANMKLREERYLQYFEEISAIPRGSGNVKEISDYLVNFAKAHNLQYVQDEAYNVIIYKAATEGYEQADTVIIQGHMDMVCEKNQDCSHDFLKDGIKLIVEGDWLRADDTTLGGDDGIAVAYALAILESNEYKHPALEAVFTVDEEVGMDGAMALDASLLKGTKILNVDSEEEGILWSSCAGGLHCGITLDLEYEAVKSDMCTMKIQLTGLQGGHSGTEINKGRANANCLLGRILHMLGKEIEYNLVEMNGGMKDNAIPREADAVIMVSKQQKAKAEEVLAVIAAIIKNEYQTKETELTISLSVQNDAEQVMNESSKEKALMLLNTLPNGVQEMSIDIEGLVETSLNIGVMRCYEKQLVLDLALRSSIGTAKDFLTDKVTMIAEYIGASCVANSSYPAWEYRPVSPLRDVCMQAFKELFGKEMSVQALHAGLECGILTDKIKNVDCVSFGPDILDIHTPKERMNLPSAKRMFDFVLRVLELSK